MNGRLDNGILCPEGADCDRCPEYEAGVTVEGFNFPGGYCGPFLPGGRMRVRESGHSGNERMDKNVLDLITDVEVIK